MKKRLLIAFAALVAGIGVAVSQDATSTLLQLLLMGSGLHSNDWGTQTNTNLGKIENAIEGYSAVSVTGGSTTLTADQARYQTIAFTGVLASNQTVVFPSTARSLNLVNSTSGAFTLAVNCGAGTSVTLTQSISYRVFCDGTNMAFAPTPIVDPFPVGAMMNYAGASAPNANYKICDGSAISRTTYSALYSAIGTAFGTGDGFTTFNIPDARGRVLAGPDSGTGRLNGWALAATGGEALHTMLTTEMPAHNHAVNDPGHSHGVTDPGHHHGLNFLTAYANGAGAGATTGGGSAGNTSTATTGLTVNSAATGITTANSGSGTAFNVVQPTLVTNCIIRVL